LPPLILCYFELCSYDERTLTKGILEKMMLDNFQVIFLIDVVLFHFTKHSR
jgi:hypothetical protein